MPLPELREGLTFDDLLLLPQESNVLPHQCDVTTVLSRHIALNIPLVASPMDTVTESATAIAIAQLGGVGFIHRNLSIERQAAEIEVVKKYESGMISDPITVAPEQPIRAALEVMHRYRISGLPVVSDDRLVGILTNRDLRFARQLDKPVREVMTSKVITARLRIGLEQAQEILQAHRIEKLPLVDEHNRLRGLITVKDMDKAVRYPNASKDSLGRLRVGAAVGVGADREERVAALVRAGVDVIVIDSAHGHSRNVIETLTAIKRQTDIDVVAGNVATAEGTRALIEAGADALRVGIGPGSICTTRVVSGVGVPQMTAIMDCVAAAEAAHVPVIADGGIRFSGDITKALAAGASSVMIGSLFAGTEESPGETILYQGRTYKLYRGMGSLGAMSERVRDRYGQHDVADSGKLVPEGIEGRVPHRGALASNIEQLVGGLQAGMGYIGAANLAELRRRARFIRVSDAGQRESHVHDVFITKEAPNYRQ